MNRARLLAFTLSMLVASADAAGACVCFFSDEPKSDSQVRQELAAAFGKAAAVFSGRVEQTTRLMITFTVDAVWKGDIPRRFVMSSGATANADGTTTISSCDFPFEEGKSYVVFADGAASRDALRAGQCTFTGEAAPTSPMSAYLDAIAERRVPALPQRRERETYKSAATDAQGRLIIVTSDNRTIVVDKEGEQTAFGAPIVSADRTAVGVQALFPNCCTSYDLPLQLVVYSAGVEHRFRGNRLPIFQWHFADAGTRVAFGQEPAHFGCATHYELRDIRSERLLAAAEIPQPCGQNPNPRPVTIPGWVALLRSVRR